MTIQLRDRNGELDAGDVYVVTPRRRALSKADEEAHILLIEPEGTLNVGDADAEAAPEVEI